MPKKGPIVELDWQPPVKLSGVHSIAWATSHPLGLPVHAVLLYTGTGGARWRALTLTGPTTKALIDFDELPGGSACRIAVMVTDGINTSRAESCPFVLPVRPCVPLILSPFDGSRIPAGQPVTFRGQGWYREEEIPETTQLSWMSSVDGELGRARALSTSLLSKGTHEITLTAGSAGRAATARVKIDVV